TGDGVDHAGNQLPDAGFALRRTDLAVEILADNNVGRGLRPIGRSFNVALFKDDSAFVISNGGGTEFPRNVVVGTLSFVETGCEIAWKLHANPLGNRNRRLYLLFHFNG